MKTCPQCGIEKPLNEFHKHKNRKSGICVWCKNCMAEYSKRYRLRPEIKIKNAERGKRYRQNNKEKIAKQNKEYRNRPEVKARKAANEKNNCLLRKYGITFNQKQKMIADQNSRCAICKEILDNGRNTHVDHNHETGKIRGILCDNCNKAIGLLRDSPIFTRAATEYLIKYNE